MNVVDALVAHHVELRQLYEQSKTDPAVFEEFMRHLVVHHTMEEKYFYDILQEEPQARHNSLEAVNEHHIIELILKDVERFPRDHERFPVKVESLGEYTAHHLDEEELEIFPMAQQVLPEETLNILGDLFTQAKDKLLGVELPAIPAALAPSPAKRPKGRKVEKSPEGGTPKGETPKGETPKGETPTAGKSTATGLGIGSLKE